MLGQHFRVRPRDYYVDGDRLCDPTLRVWSASRWAGRLRSQADAPGAEVRAIHFSADMRETGSEIGDKGVSLIPGGVVDPAAIRTARLAAGLTQQELARRVGVAGGDRVSKWESGTAEPRPATLHRLATVLDVEPVNLLSPLDDSPDLRRLRMLAGKSASTVANMAHLSSTTYQRWEAGGLGQLPPPAALSALGKVLGVSAAEVGSAIRAARRGSG